MSNIFSASLYLFILLIFFVAIVAMFVSLGRKGDERRKMIVQKSAANTFYICLGVYLIDIFKNIFTSFVYGKAEIEAVLIYSLSRLTVVAVIYLIQLFYYNRKFGV